MAIQYKAGNKVKRFRQLVEENWQNPNSAILKHIETTADSKGYPNIPNWLDFTQGKDEVEVYSTLMHYIMTKKLPLPSSIGHSDSVQQLFLKSIKKAKGPFVHVNDLDRPLIHRLSESQKYSHDYDQYTLGYFPQYIQLNVISNYFAEHERLKCEIINKESPTFLWTEEHGVSRLMDTMRRVGIKSLHETKFKGIFGFAGQIAAQFNVNTAKNLYNAVPGKTIFDISCGWGDRLTGFYLSNKKSYYGTDPNSEMFRIYKKMCLQYEQWLGNSNPKVIEGEKYFEIRGVKNVRIYNLPAEDLNYNEIPDIDLTFSSPPYFNKELYGKNSSSEENQSWNRYKTGDAWLEDFLYCIMDQLVPKSKTTMINITDIGIDKHRVFICDPMVEKYKKHFVGIAGFQMSQNMNVGQKKKGQIYTEPIWTFGENPFPQRKTIISHFE